MAEIWDMGLRRSKISPQKDFQDLSGLPWIPSIDMGSPSSLIVKNQQLELAERALPNPIKSLSSWEVRVISWEK